MMHQQVHFPIETRALCVFMCFELSNCMQTFTFFLITETNYLECNKIKTEWNVLKIHHLTIVNDLHLQL